MAATSQTPLGLTSPVLAHFRPGIGAVGRGLLPFYGLICAIGLPIALWKGQSPLEIALGLLAAALSTAAFAPLLAWILRPLSLQVHAEGVVGRSFWGRRSLIRWTAAGELQRDDSSGLRLVIIPCLDGSPPVWTRPDVIEDEEFQRLAQAFAPADCPLLLELPPGLGPQPLP